MNPDQKELSFDESIKEVMRTLPPVIRSYLAQGKYTAVAKGLMSKYGLRIDQAGVLEREIMLLLMGIEDPNDFTKALTEDVQLDEKAVNSIVQDVNNQIFVPLREEERKSGMSAPAQPAQQPVSQPAKPVVVAPQPPHFPHLENKIPTQNKGSQTSLKSVSNIAPLPPKVVMPQVVRTTGSLGDAVRAALETKAPPEASTLLEDHEEPHIEISEVRPSPAIPKVEPQMQPVVPKAEFKMPPVAVEPPRPIAIAPVNLPGALPPIITEMNPVSAVQPKVVPPTPPTQAAPLKSYSADPYREPIDDVPGA